MQVDKKRIAMIFPCDGRSDRREVRAVVSANASGWGESVQWYVLYVSVVSRMPCDARKAGPFRWE